MKICHLGEDNIHTGRYLEYFARTNHEVYLLTFDEVGKTERLGLVKNIKNLKIYKIPFHKSFFPFSLILTILITRRLVKKISPDILHAHNIPNYGFLGAISRFHPLVVTSWGSDVSDAVKRPFLYLAIKHIIVKYVLKRADLVHCMDKSIYNRAKHLVDDTGNMKVIPSGIFSSLFKPKTKREKSNKIRILYLRRSQWAYKPEVLINAIPKIIKKYKNVEFLIRNEGENIKKTHEMVNKYGLENYVRFIDRVPNKKLPEVLNSADIYVDTTVFDVGIGKTALEAMCCGLPAVLADNVGTKVFIEDGAPIVSYKHDDSNSLANVIVKLIEGKKLREEVGEKGRDYVLEKQDFNKNMKVMGNFYHRLSKQIPTRKR